MYKAAQWLCVFVEPEARAQCMLAMRYVQTVLRVCLLYCERFAIGVRVPVETSYVQSPNDFPPVVELATLACMCEES